MTNTEVAQEAPKEAPKKAPKLKKIPGHSQGVSMNSSARRIVLNAPICPFSQKQYTQDDQGRRVEKEHRSGETNCQLAGGKWWIDCEERGHDPYFTHKKYYTTEDIYEEQDGRSILKGKQRIVHEDVYPNLNSVFVNTRINNGRGVLDSIKNKGRRRLAEAGYEEVCQYRNCQNPINPKFHSVPYGDYCSKDHMGAAIANERGVILPVPNGKFNAGKEHNVLQMRDAMIREAVWNSREDD